VIDTVTERIGTMAKANAICSTKLLVCAGLLTVAALVGCGGSGGGTRGLGGSTGSGGSTGGGLGGTQGTAGAGMGGMLAALDCAAGVDPAAPLLVDFSSTTWMNTQGKWSPIARDLTGSKYSAGGGKSAPDGGLMTAMTNMITTDAANPAFELMGTVVASDYAFGLLSFDRCVNTGKYVGIQFTIGGNTGGCDLYLLLQTFEQQGVVNRGGCPTGNSCYNFPRKLLTVPSTPGPVTVLFSDLENTGIPTTAAAMKAEIVGLQWQFQSPPPPDGGTQVNCTGIDVTIDDVGFATGP
jgi:hypothetical protein